MAQTQFTEQSRLSSAADGGATSRAGLRVRPADAQPTGAFVVVEMTILVIVAALAMVSLIVSSSDGFADDRRSVSAPDVRATPLRAPAIDAFTTRPVASRDRHAIASGLEAR